MTSDVPLIYHKETVSAAQTRALGACWVAYGVLRLAITVWLIGFATTATLMFGALLTRVPDPYSLMAFFHFVYSGIMVWSAACGVLGVLAGVAFLTGQRAARLLAIIAALISLPELPFGIMLGVYTLIVLLNTAPAAPYSRGTRT